MLMSFFFCYLIENTSRNNTTDVQLVLGTTILLLGVAKNLSTNHEVSHIRQFI